MIASNLVSIGFDSGLPPQRHPDGGRGELGFRTLVIYNVTLNFLRLSCEQNGRGEDDILVRRAEGAWGCHGEQKAGLIAAFFHPQTSPLLLSRVLAPAKRHCYPEPVIEHLVIPVHAGGNDPLSQIRKQRLRF